MLVQNSNQSLTLFRDVSLRTDTNLQQLYNQGISSAKITEQSNHLISTVSNQVDEVNDRLKVLGQHTFEGMINNAVSKALNSHQQGLVKNKDLKSLMGGCDLGHIQQSFSKDPRRRRCSRIVYQIRYNFVLFDVHIRTTEEKRSCQVTDPDILPTERHTRYDIRARFPFPDQGTLFRYMHSRFSTGQAIGSYIGYYQLLPDDAPIIAAVKNFDFAEVKRLFDAGLASPFDKRYTDSHSLMEIAINATMEFWYQDALNVPHTITVAKIPKNSEIRRSNASSLLELLIPLSDTISRDVALNYLLYLSSASSSFTTLLHVSEEPFHSSDIIWNMEYDWEGHPIYQILQEQQHWVIDFDHHMLNGAQKPTSKIAGKC